MFIDSDGRKLKVANNYAGCLENIAQIAATNLGNQVLNNLIGANETYTLNATFLSSMSSYDPNNRYINYVADPWFLEIPFDGGTLNSMVAIGHESFHAFDHSNSYYNEKNAAYHIDVIEPRAVSFGNYLRNIYSLFPLREKYGSVQGDFNQFVGDEEHISNFSCLGSNGGKTSYGFCYSKTSTTIDSYKTNSLE